jgi:hypothetical protein
MVSLFCWTFKARWVARLFYHRPPTVKIVAWVGHPGAAARKAEKILNEREHQADHDAPQQVTRASRLQEVIGRS